MASVGAAVLRTGRYAILSDESSTPKSDPRSGDPCGPVELGVAKLFTHRVAYRLDRPLDPLWQQHGHRISRFLAEGVFRDLGSVPVDLATCAAPSKTRLSMSPTDQPKSPPPGHPESHAASSGPFISDRVVAAT